MKITTQNSPLEIALEYSGAYVYTKDINGKYTFANKMVCELLELPLEQIIGRTDEDFFDLAVCNESRDYDAMVLVEGKKIEKEETLFVKRFNDLRIYWSVKTPLFDNSGNISGLCGISIDITKKFHVRKEVEKSNQILNSVLNNSQALIYMKDADLRYTYVNSNTANAIGLSQKEMIGKKSNDIFPKTTAEKINKLDQNILKNGIKHEEELDLPNQKGIKHHLRSVRLPLFENGKVTGIMGMYYDITEKLETEKKLTEANHILETILSNIPANIFMKDSDLRYTYINKHIVDEFGEKSENIIGKVDHELFPKEIAEELVKIDSNVISLKKKYIGEEILADISGNLKNYQVVKVPLTYEGSNTGLIGISVDMSELTQLRKELKEQNDQLKHLLEQRNRFMGMVVHDLRSPAGSIMGLSEILDLDLTGDSKEINNLIHQSSSGMLDLINDLLDISAIESGNLTLNKEETEYINLSQQIVKLNQFAADKKNISIDQISDITEQNLSIDKLKIEQVLNNLLGNAIKYSHKSTQITVKISIKDKKVITEIIDQGQGIKQEELDGIFGYFKKTSTTPTNKESSHGLGLVIVQKIVEGHGGTISVESEFGKGSTFSFALPLS